MFSGIVTGLAHVADMQKRNDDAKLTLAQLPAATARGLAAGMSVAVNGCCLTVVEASGDEALFDLSRETLDRTTLDGLEAGQAVNVEAAMRFGDPIGGHEMSGHVDGTAALVQKQESGNGAVLTFQLPSDLVPFVFDKGYIGMNGASLTVTDLDRETGHFDVHLIPETLRLTTFGAMAGGEIVNVEMDRRTQAVVETVRSLVRDAGGVEAFLKQVG